MKSNYFACHEYALTLRTDDDKYTFMMSSYYSCRNVEKK